LLDIRALYNDVNPLDCYIHYLGFNQGHGSAEVGTDVHVANNAVTSLPGVLPDSQVLHDRFEAIASDNSMAYRYLREYGPYHLVNLDLCGSMFPNTEQDVQPLFTAVDRLLKYQFAKQTTNWLLLITSAVKPAVLDRNLMQKLCKPTRDNVDRHRPFAEKVAQLVPSSSFPEGSDSVSLAGLSDGQLVQLFGLALGKWLLHLGQSPSPQWTVAMRRSFRYTISESAGAMMLSLAYDMSPNIAPPVDGTGMSTLAGQRRTFPSEGECAVKLAESVSSIVDVESALAADPAMKASLRDESANLLAATGYDRNAYLRWVSDGEGHGAGADRCAVCPGAVPATQEAAGGTEL